MTDSSSLKPQAVSFLHTPSLTSLFAQERFSLIVSSYQAQRIMTISPGKESLSLTMRTLPHPTGMALSDRELAIYSRYQVWLFRRFAKKDQILGELPTHDWAVSPQISHVTGDIDGHEMEWIGSKLVITNTLFSCLCELSDEYSFQPIWKPPFISKLAPEDRCHLNGIASDDTGIKFLSAFSTTDTPEGWRGDRNSSGVILEYPTGKPLVDGLCMPHSPRLYHGRLWVLESGRGTLVSFDLSTGSKTVHAALPGYTRGLAFYKNFAFIGLSKARESQLAEGLAPDFKEKDLMCGIVVFDIAANQLLGEMRFARGIEELFDIKVLSNVISPYVVGFEDETVNRIFLMRP